MATTFTDLNGTGVASRQFSFPSYKVGDIKVEVDGVAYENRTISGASASTTTFTISGYTTTGGGNVVFDTAPTSDPLQLIRIYRDTDVDTAKASYQAGSSVKAEDLNNNHKQLLYAAQEEQNQTIIASDIKDGVITSAKITDGTIVNADINASAAIAGTKISPAFGSQNISLTGNITVSGTVDGRDVSADGTKLDGIEPNATADQTAAQIRALVGNALDSNVFTDADHTKLNSIESNAKDDQTAAEIRSLVESANDSNVFTDADHSKLDSISVSDITANTAKNTNVTTNLTTSTSTTSVTVNSSDGTNATIGEATGSAAGVMSVAHHDKLDNIEAGATADQTAEEIQDIVGAMLSGNTESGITVTYQDSDGTIDFSVASQTDQNFTNADHSKLDGIEPNATADQTNAEIKTAYEANSNTNAFTDAEQTKLGNAVTLTDAQTLTNKTLTTPVINDMSGTAVVTSGTSTSDNKVYSAKRSDELYSTGASQAATSATAAANSATAAASSQSAAASSATAAASSATTASTQATNAAASATSAESDLNTFKGQYFGALASDPVTDPLSNAINQGDIYFNTTSEQVRIFNGSAFQGISENSVDASRFATSGFESLYTASAGSNSINLGGLAISGAVFSTENIPSIRSSLAKGSATYNLGGL